MGTGTSVRTKIRQAVKYQLQQITTANGYRKTIPRVYDPPKNMENMVEYPAVNLLWGREVETERRIAGNKQMLDIELTCMMDIFLKEHDDLMLDEIDKVIADVQERFGTYFYIPGSDGVRTAFNCLFVSSEPFGTEATKPNCGVTIELLIWYRIKLADPTAMG